MRRRIAHVKRGKAPCGVARLAHYDYISFDQIEHWPLERLIPYARNARTHSDEQIEQIERSIREFGFTNPVLVDTGCGILAGHARLLAARRVGLAEVPVIILDHLTETQKRA